MARYCHFLEPVTEPERLLHLSFPVNDVSHDLVHAIKVAATDDLLDSRMQLLLSDPLIFKVRSDTMHHQDQIDLFLLVILHFLHAKLRLKFNVLPPRRLSHTWPILSRWRLQQIPVVVQNLGHLAIRSFFLLFSDVKNELL